jgi:BlaI family transcriptional regulator, penicillinase repressor
MVTNIMKRDSPKAPTQSELEILRVLWERGPSTVKDVHETLSATKPVGYTTVLKLLQIMTVKGTVTRNERDRAHVYEAWQPAERTKRQLAGEMLQKVFGGSASELVLHALSGQRASHQEIEQIRRLLDEYERKLP